MGVAANRDNTGESALLNQSVKRALQKGCSSSFSPRSSYIVSSSGEHRSFSASISATYSILRNNATRPVLLGRITNDVRVQSALQICEYQKNTDSFPVCPNFRSAGYAAGRSASTRWNNFPSEREIIGMHSESRESKPSSPCPMQCRQRLKFL